MTLSDHVDYMPRILAINVARLGLASPTDQSDMPRTLAYQAIFINLETQVGVITACLPTLKPLLSWKRSEVLRGHGSPHYVTPSYESSTIGSGKVAIGGKILEKMDALDSS